MSVLSSSTAVVDAPRPLVGQPSRVELLARYFRVFGHPTRLGLLELLAERERSVGELVDALGLAQPKVSNHLACLRWCGFVSTRREQRSVFYAIADERVLDVVALGRGLLDGHAEQVATCGRVDQGGC